ncbi:hypothetical protein ACDQ55_10060 [Chitinophaga sp. 30R24]|uniref:hypothetical protein n=1 Tax=Chitinophaga sp. 30R24 TaxID=3248838 RepID=UPI003B920AF3
MQLQQAGVYTQAEYVAWLAASRGYATLTLSDASRWILRLATGKTVYIHLHPGRYSPHTFRVKAAALKTALIYCWAIRKEHLLPEDKTVYINQLRAHLQLPPLKNAAESSHIMALVAKLENGLKEI